jgi:type VI secretion system protein ImpC
MPLVYRKNSNVAAFIGARTIHRPRNYGDDEANENSELSSRLPYVFAVSRFAHYLKSIGRDKIGSFTSQGEIQRWLKSWVMRYVDGDPSISSEEVKARRPLADADVTVEEMPGDPGYYYTTFHLRPHYQLEGLTVSLRLVGKMPNAQVAAAGDALGAGAALAAPEAITAG